MRATTMKGKKTVMAGGISQSKNGAAAFRNPKTATEGDKRPGTYESPLDESIHGVMGELFEIGLISSKKMNTFDELCLTRA